MQIISSAFKDNELIPQKYTCDGENISPPLSFINVPEETKSLVLIVDDPDAPDDTFVHWLLWNIRPQTKKIVENSLPEGAVSGKTSAGGTGYVGPCPPSGLHRYFFKLYAMDNTLDLPAESEKQQLEEEMIGHIIQKAQIIGMYKKTG